MSKSLKLIIESMLFSSERPLTVNDIRSCLPDVEIQEIKSAIEVLKYEFDALERSFELKEVAKGFQLRSRPEYGAYILRMLQRSPNRLSRASMETLAIIAYKQPILRQEIERLRGVDVGGILRTLLEKGLIRIMGRKDLPGKPLIYGTTKLFLETFDLKDISSLPKLKEIKKFGTEEYDPTPGITDEEEVEQPGEKTFEAVTSTPDDDTMEVPFEADIEEHGDSYDEKVPEEATEEKTPGDETRNSDAKSADSQDEEFNQKSAGEVDRSVSDSGEEPTQGSIKSTPEN